ncbi:hypothetical protein FIBSPDRAFT_962438 [Athelia psychrophila]|uniref:Uncharacterized protein n=1 Tax=Athelia psychrophila TaxID=1759441 RepID=A0A166A3S6_9AGAM|nr:hypothetical protein FIBSPDRAFT_962438 [Fibularhizoctonia sp. CBS 109695]
MFVWALLINDIAHSLDWAGQRVLWLENWMILAASRASSNALLLLLLLESPKMTGRYAARARTIMLLNSMMSTAPFVRAADNPGPRSSAEGDVSDASDNEDSDAEGRTIGGQADIMSGAAPHAIPSKVTRVRVFGIERAKKRTPGKTLGNGLGKTWEAERASMNPALVGGLAVLYLRLCSADVRPEGQADRVGSAARFMYILVSSSPPFRLLLSVAQQVHVDEGPVAGFLVVTELCAPLMVFVCSMGMAVV